MEEMSAAVNAAISPTVKLWTNWMFVIFVTSVLFTWQHVSARFILAAFVLTLPIAVFIFQQTQQVHLLGISHLIVWAPLLIYLITFEFIKKQTRPNTPYGVYLVLLVATIAISLVFDVRDIFLVMTGQR